MCEFEKKMDLVLKPLILEGGSEGDFLPKFFGMFCEIFSVVESSDPLRCGWDLYKKSDFFDFKMLGSIFLQLQFSKREFLHNINSVLCNKLQCKS